MYFLHIHLHCGYNVGFATGGWRSQTASGKSALYFIIVSFAVLVPLEPKKSILYSELLLLEHVVL